MKTVFNKSVPPACRYCRHGQVLSYTKQVMCPKKGICELGDSCRSYQYDPLKREPAKLTMNRDFDKKDFLL